MDTCSSARKTCFVEEDDGLASLVDVEAGYSGKTQHPFFSRSICYPRKSSLRNLSSTVSSPRSVRFYDARFEDNQPHFLEACFLCKKPLGGNRDIFMYRGDTPFCSEECRQEQIEIDEAKEKNWNLSSSVKALRKKDQKKSSSPNKAQNYPLRTGTVAAA
ncbi:hypothetical protein HS088_TW16G00708 [Tripterygium wilfordii]|uniref:FLZ-type domain-containing protein n=1 Tax=Tripterygium wilfordii TaxID=458696 RepID=A0A7J7CJS7_TRIWF|nr:FCS-Like Zinc finger 1-like [Tripterygium wilfordii]XP_038679547.1 FCS-Like Zinc finger 1-like [Tripterygium wilfordii]KAF5734252.1 hypothetical protein HS088_TW16G00699 [Tripterygium wilfordii]KAF5734261.1 hypothetical protein HS088_TW16G00708 [Tripterygium wilfordii]